MQRFREVSDACQRCGFDAYRVVQQFNFTAPVLEQVIDNAGVISSSWRSELDSAFAKLRRRFPQVGFHICTVELDDPIKLPEFGFWMMNACRLEPHQQESDRAWSMLVLVDVKRGLVSLTPGYALEAFIEDSAWEDSLRQISLTLAEGDYRKGLLGFLTHAERLLLAAGKEAIRKEKKS
ncbi:MAG: TPM domain-containing protein [Akkermansiaceae bacterium]